MFSAAVYQVDHMCSGEFCANVLAHTVYTGRLYLSALFLHSTPIPSELHSLAHSLTPLFLPFPFSPFICFLLLMQCSVVFAWSGSSRRGDTACPPIRRAGVLSEQCHLQSHALIFRSQPYTEAEQARCHFGKWRSLFVSVFKLFALIILFTVSVKENIICFLVN